MPQSLKSAVISAMTALIMAAPAMAGTFTLNPNTVGLNGTKLTADTFVLSDYAQITFTPTGLTPDGNLTATFLDTGYLPVIGFRLNGQEVTPSDYLPSNGGGWGAYIQYTGTGTQILSPQGAPLSATYSKLDYSIVGYNGLATFGRDAKTGAATVGSAISNVTTLDTGSLVSGSLAFAYTQGGPPAPTIIGQITATLGEAKPQFIEGNPGGLSVTFIHPPGEYFFTSATTLEIAGGKSSSATIVSSGSSSTSALAGVALPEPASAALLGLGLAGIAGLRAARFATGRQGAKQG